MEGLTKMLGMMPKDHALGSSSSENSSFAGVSSSLSSGQCRALVTRAPRQVVSLWTCSKLCAIFFAAGVVVGYTLKRRVRRWASRLLKRMKDD